MTLRIRSLLLGSLLALPIAATAGAQGRTSTSAAPSLVVAAMNTSAGASRRSVRPNDVLRYTLTFSNPTGRSLANVELKDAIPAGVHFVAASTHASRADARVEFSADGGKSWSAQPMETVMVNGQPVQRAVDADRFTHLRWVVAGSVAPGAKVVADFEAKVSGAGA